MTDDRVVTVIASQQLGQDDDQQGGEQIPLHQAAAGERPDEDERRHGREHVGSDQGTLVEVIQTDP